MYALPLTNALAPSLACFAWHNPNMLLFHYLPDLLLPASAFSALPHISACLEKKPGVV